MFLPVSKSIVDLGIAAFSRRRSVELAFSRVAVWIVLATPTIDSPSTGAVSYTHLAVL